MPSNALNNPSMPRPEAVRRVKSYSAATGYVYQYYFYEVEKTRRGNTPGTEYVYMVSVDRHHVFPVRIFVQHEALEDWSARTGQKLTGTEEYAVAKMRLFQAFDEIEKLDAKTPELVVDSSNLETLLSQLDILTDEPGQH
jgi:hypothetical protein